MLWVSWPYSEILRLLRNLLQNYEKLQGTLDKAEHTEKTFGPWISCISNFSVWSSTIRNTEGAF